MNNNVDRCCLRSKILRKREIKKYLFILSVIGIQLIFFCVFYIGVNFQSITMSFRKISVSGAGLTWTFDHFIRFFDTFLKTPSIILATRNTLIFFVFNIAMLLISFITSYFLYKKIFGYSIFRIVFFFPTVISAVVWSTIFKNIVGVHGPIARIFQGITHTTYPPAFLADSRYALTFVLFYSFWLGIAGNFVLFGGALARIPESVIEAGKLDGLGWFKELIFVIFPLVWPTFSTILILKLTGIFTSTGNILLLTAGSYNTNTISYMIFAGVYNRGATADTSLSTLGYTAALGLIFTLLTIPIVFLSVRLLKKVEDVAY